MPNDPPQIPHGLTWDSNCALCIEKSATDCLAVKKQGISKKIQDVTSEDGSDREIQFVVA